jgi:hypothetical protein
MDLSGEARACCWGNASDGIWSSPTPAAQRAGWCRARNPLGGPNSDVQGRARQAHNSALSWVLQVSGAQAIKY